MNLTAFAIRVILRKLLLGRTWAGNFVKDSPLDPVVQLLTAASETLGQNIGPGIAIYTSKASTKVALGKMLQNSPHEIDLIIYSYLPPTFTREVPAPEGQPPGTVDLEVEYAGSSVALDFVARQVQGAMASGVQPWLDLWKIFVVSIDGVLSRGVLVQTDKGIQIPSVEATYSLCTVGDPNFGTALFGGWLGLYNAMVADGELSAFASTLKQLIEEPENLPNWRIVQAMLGITQAGSRALGDAPQDPTQLTDDAHVITDDDDGIDFVLDTDPIEEPEP